MGLCKKCNGPIKNKMPCKCMTKVVSKPVKKAKTKNGY
jgi:hypothetical protein